MRTITVRTGLGLAVAIFTAGVAGCAHHDQGQTPGQTDVQQRGADMQKGGTMSQADYVRVDTLEHQTAQTHTISDADLDWTLGLLGSATNAIARARAMTALSQIRPMSAAQKAKIAPAITPYLSSTDTLDQVGAQRVQKAMDATS